MHCQLCLAVSQQSLKFGFEHHADIPSTNGYLKQQINSGNIHTALCVLADHQSAGYGRRLTPWVSKKNISLTFSLALPWHKDEGTSVTLAVGVVLAEYLRNMGVNAYLKWPNDVYIFDKASSPPQNVGKIAGILVEKVRSPVNSWLIIGIGINLAEDTENHIPGAKLCDHVKNSAVHSDPLSLRQVVLPAILKNLWTTLQQFLREGFNDSWRARWHALHGWQNANVQVTSYAEVLRGRANGINTDGHLVICDEKNVVHTLTVADYDFNKSRLQSDFL